LITQTSSCDYRSCTSNCYNATLPSESYDERFGFYACLPQTSLVGIVYTQAFPEYGDFIRPNLPMEYSVALRRNYNISLVLSFVEVNTTLGSSCYEYINFDDTPLPSADTIPLTCTLSDTNNLTMSGITFQQNLNTLVTFALEGRRMSGHHLRFIDYEQSKLNFLKKKKIILFYFIGDSRCRYQGIYHPYVNQCVCSPGFYGDECQFSKSKKKF
jgi:hypothetical protein